jgi:hypothetical protein
VYFTPTLRAALAEQLERVDAFRRKLSPRDPKTGRRRYVRGIDGRTPEGMG